MGTTNPTASAHTHGAPDFTRERCKQCGICTHFCPKGAIELDADGLPQIVDPDACTACRLCEYLCPDFGIRVRSNGSEAPAGVAPDPDSTE